MNRYPTKEVEGEEELSPLSQELISSYRDHIMTLKKEIEALKAKYEPKIPERLTNSPARIPIKPRLASHSAIIQELERRTKLKVGDGDV